MAKKFDATKIVEILDPQSGKLRETVIDKPRNDTQDMVEQLENNMGISGMGRMTLREAGFASTSQFPALLRDGLRPILFSAYSGVPQTYPLWAEVQQSDKPFEDYLEGSRIGLLPIVGEGEAYPAVDLALDRAFQIRNDKRGGIIQITREMVLFDRVGMIRDMVADLGNALAMTKEQDAYTLATTAGGYVRNSTTGDNDEGANTLSTAFSPGGLVIARRTLVTMKDRKSGRYLGVQPDTLIIGPDLEFAAKQLLTGDAIQRVGGSTTNDVYGSGTSNPFKGLITNIVISPFMVEGNWILCQAKKFVVCQEVWGPELFALTNMAESTNFMHYDLFEYRADANYGFGMKNDRFAFLSTSTAAPIVN